MNSRGWTPIDGDPRWEDEGYYGEVSAKLDGLMLWWSQLTHEAEQRQWARERDLDEGYRYNGEDAPMRRDYDRGPEGDAEYEAELAQWVAEFAAFNKARHAKDEMARSQMEFIETQLHEAGARVMRPYEHWNEDERYMEYMERSR